jgi:hypothetical protein
MMGYGSHNGWRAYVTSNDSDMTRVATPSFFSTTYFNASERNRGRALTAARNQFDLSWKNPMIRCMLAVVSFIG